MLSAAGDAVLAGPRLSKLTESTRGGLDIHAGGLRLGKKTVADTDRYLELSAFLIDELRGHIAGVPTEMRDRPGAAAVSPGPGAS